MLFSFTGTLTITAGSVRTPADANDAQTKVNELLAYSEEKNTP